MLCENLKTLYNQGLTTKTVEYRICFYPLFPELQIVIFSKIGTGENHSTAREAEILANLVVSNFELEPRTTVWIEEKSNPFKDYLGEARFSLVTFDWHNGQARDPRWLPIVESWYLSWLEDENNCTND